MDEYNVCNVNIFDSSKSSSIIKKPHRTRKKPVRKWSEEQQRTLINFLRDNLPIEKPTARAYYQRFFDESHISIEWELVRAKVRNLRVRFTQAKLWNSSNDAMSLSEEQKRAMILKMCSYYDDFEEISKHYEMSLTDLYLVKRGESQETHLGSQPELVSPRNTLSSGIGDSDVDQAESEQTYDLLGAKVKVEEGFNLYQSINRSMNNCNEIPDSSYGNHNLGHEYQYSNNVPSIISDHPNERGKQDDLDETNLERQKMLEKRQFKEKKLALKIEKFNFEKEKFLKEQELRKWELDSQERIRKLELEMQERIAMRELQIKDRFASIKFKRKRRL